MMPAGDNSWLIHRSSLAVLPAEASGISRRNGRRSENFAYQYLKYLKGSLTCRKILRHETSGFTSHPKEGDLWIFVTLKNPTPQPGLYSRPLVPVASTQTTAPPRRLEVETETSYLYVRRALKNKCRFFLHNSILVMIFLVVLWLRWFLAAETRVRARISPCGIGGQRGTGSGSPSSCQYHSTVAVHIRISCREWIIDPLVAAFQRRNPTPWTWTTIWIVFLATWSDKLTRRLETSKQQMKLDTYCSIGKNPLTLASAGIFCVCCTRDVRLFRRICGLLTNLQQF
jgi:hypothetical protein